jgi:hypothetical protein
VLSEEQRRERLHRAYVYILSLRPEHTSSQIGMTDKPSTESIAETPASADEGTEDNAANGPDKDAIRAFQD